MQTIGAAANVITAVVAVLAVLIAVFELRRGQANAAAARAAELSWNIYLAYDSPELREGRRSLNTVSRSEPVPATGKEFGEMYVKRTEAKVSEGSIRRVLRFYHQVGILLDERLIDPDFVFPLIGDGLETSKEGIRVATQWHQNFYGGPSGQEERPPRRIYANAVVLTEKYERWKAEIGSR